jgi:response regulator of citrate/malate metabolism
MNGVKFLETYSQHPLAQKCELVIVVLTTSEHSRDLDRIKTSPVVADILTKPLTQKKVETILNQHYQRRLSA